MHIFSIIFVTCETVLEFRISVLFLHLYSKWVCMTQDERYLVRLCWRTLIYVRYPNWPFTFEKFVDLFSKKIKVVFLIRHWPKKGLTLRIIDLWPLGNSWTEARYCSRETETRKEYEKNGHGENLQQNWLVIFLKCTARHSGWSMFF